jgi:hypothetical protein
MEFENFKEYLHDIIFQKTSEYLSDCIGTNDWGEELHEAHGLIMYNVVKAISKKMNIK